MHAAYTYRRKFDYILSLTQIIMSTLLTNVINLLIKFDALIYNTLVSY